MPTSSDNNWSDITWTSSTDSSNFIINTNVWKIKEPRFKAKMQEGVEEEITEEKATFNVRCNYCGKIFEYDPSNEDSDSAYCSVKCRLEGKYIKTSLPSDLFTEEGVEE